MADTPHQRFSDLQDTIQAKKRECNAVLLNSFLNIIAQATREGAKTTSTTLFLDDAKGKYRDSMHFKNVPSCNDILTRRDILNVVRSVKRLGYRAKSYDHGNHERIIVDLTREKISSESSEGKAYLLGILCGGSLGVILGGMLCSR